MRKFYIFSYVTILLVSLCQGVAHAANTDPAFRDLSILVSSCDKYAQLWQPFFVALERNWPELIDNSRNNAVDIFLIANAKNYPSSHVKMINIRNEISWSDNMLLALDKVQTKYVLLFLDDYWLDAKVDHARFKQLYSALVQHDAAYVQLFVSENLPKNLQQVGNVPGLVHKQKFEKFRASLQLAIWETKALKQILRSKESAWDFELAASIRSSGYPKEFLTLSANAPISYINASHQSHITPQALDFAKKINPNFVARMPVLQKRNWLLIKKRIKHRYETIVALIERNVNGADDNSYRYKFERN